MSERGVGLRLAAAGVLLSGIGLGTSFTIALAIGVILFGMGMLLWARSLGRQLDALGARMSGLRDLVQVRPLIGELPVELDGWAADSEFLEAVALTIGRVRPDRVLELGSGSSSVLISRTLSALGHGRLIAVDHEAKFAGATARMLTTGALEDNYQIVVAPLTTRSVDGVAWSWYSEAVEGSLDGPVDLLVVDGPPGRGSAKARYPAVPLLLSRLAPRCVIMLHDGMREDESWIAARWGEALGVRPVLLSKGKGTWVLERTTSVGP